MDLSKSLELEITKVITDYWDTYFSGNLADYSRFLRDDYHNIGTTESENWTSKAEMMEYSEAVIDQLVGTVQIRNRNIHIQPIEPYFMVNEHIDLFIKTGDEWVFYNHMRLTSLIEKLEEGWKFIHQHGSVPDSKADEGESIGFQKITQENLELRDAIKRRTIELEQKNRKLQIEAALERTRSQSLLMKNSGELNGISKTFHEQMLLLGIDCEFSFVWLPDEERSEHLFWATWMSEINGSPIYHSRSINYPMDKAEPGTAACFVAWESGEAVHETFVSPGDIGSFFATWEELLDGAEHFRPELFPDGIYYTEAYMKYGCFGIDIRRRLTVDEKQILKRFSTEFERAYTRFLDLKKAEAQAREAEIQLALERVRAVAMGMNKPEDMLEVCRVISDQLQKFGVDHIRNVQTVIINVESGTYHNYQYFTQYEKESIEVVDYHKNKIVNELSTRMLESADGFFTGCLKGTDFTDFRSFRKRENQFPDPLLDETDSIDYHFYSIGLGGLGLTLYRPLDQDGLVIFRRFHNVFSLAYRRFRDIELAETQAREVQKELSLERIRAQVTAMHESSDLLDIVVTMRTEFVKLGHEAHYFWHMRWLPDTYAKAMTSGDGSRIGMVMTLPRLIHGDIQPVAAWERSNDPTYVLAMDVDTAVDYVHKMITLGDFEQVDPQSPTLDDIRRIGGLTFVMARTTHGEIGFSLPGVVPNPNRDAIDTLVRFAGVFDLAYKRFEDLKVAERQHRESQIELALERVRARSLAMYSTNELTEIIKSVDDQLKELNVVNSGGAFIVINKELDNGFSCWGSGGVGNYVRKVDIPYLDSPIYHRLNEGILARIPFFTEQYDEEEKHAFFRHLFSHPPFDVTPIERQQALLTLSNGYSRSCVVSENTSIFIINHHGVPFSDEENGILKQMGRVFEQSYTRYLDIEKAENQAKLIREERDRLELALNELHATQSQLIQQEKLASLGQLTAGIAHEIKNPLNFVNNFSSVSLELVDEAMEEVVMVQTQRQKETLDNETHDPVETHGRASLHDQDADATNVKTHGRASLQGLSDLLSDIKANLTKIHEHGSRADGIVKSMLQHSRGGSGKMEPADLNAVVKEFVNLSYHGMRAGTHPIDVEIQMDLDESIGDIPMVTEDFSRVIVNICSNAFDAMRMSVIGDREIEGAYLSHLNVRTKREGNRIVIEIEDNGPGIPDDIKDKILQPFFTTKKGTQGTGLGLSITHDIVKAHGGVLAIESQPGQTVFTISLTT